MDDDIQVLTLPYNNDLYAIYNRTSNARVLVILVFQLILTITHWVLAFVIPFKRNEFSSKYERFEYEVVDSLLNSYNLIIYSQLILWAIFLIVRFYFKNIYYHRLRILGYNNHHDKIMKFVMFPSLILHKSNALMLLLTIIMSQLKDIHINDIHIKPIHGVEIVISLGSVANVVNLIIHIYHELKFRRVRNPPDVFCVGDHSTRLSSDGLSQVAIRSSSFLEDLLENQSDLIYNLKLQNTHLRELLFKATQPDSSSNEPESNSNALI